MPYSKDNTQELREVLEVHKLLRDWFALHPIIPDGGASKVEREDCMKTLAGKIEELIKKTKST